MAIINKKKQDTQYAQKLNEMIRNKAYELFLNRGATPGRELNDWVEAERIVKQEMRRNKP